MSTPIVTGFYRYTDCWFTWPDLVPQYKEAVKSVLAHDSLVDSGHPLHPGVEGITLTRGVLKENGEARLLFTSKQIDYLRYWLHEMGLTEEMVPLPHSDALIMKDELESAEPVFFKTGGDLRGAVKQIDKENKRSKNAPNSLASLRVAFERTRTAWNAKRGTWIAIDVEDWELAHKVLLEFGYSLIYFDGDKEHSEDAHFTFSSTLSCHNGQYVADNRRNYVFGETTVLPKPAAFKPKLAELILSSQKRGPVFLVFHNHSQDIKSLEQLEAPIQSLVYTLPLEAPSEGLFVVDTQNLFSALIGSSQGNGLAQVCNHLRIEKANSTTLHNAGNDAKFTLTALRAMVGDEPLDALREKLWPNRTPAGLEVKFQPWEEDADYSDQEGM
ncbi:hypothetical protein MIND_00740700 [Mycena indigotica]|uniref:Gfd2/YDR514C-like C-terminal domain-containing protein n=1 Tax=Mycena indigotica TaxID=2126181 RepID=A0A8H6SN78_9AGAR|nr:uncharacterized protein MIND_00740700 [Mycena indigotica]KAF7301751.1 hypothetical protein MIND_00740700 [Mycena indigotica]